MDAFEAAQAPGALDDGQARLSTAGYLAAQGDDAVADTQGLPHAIAVTTATAQIAQSHELHTFAVMP